jgi:hypothetical protein
LRSWSRASASRSSSAERLLRLERHRDVLEAREARSPERREYTDEEIVEIGLGLLAYVYGGDTERYAREHLAFDGRLPLREALREAATLGRILEVRRETAPNPEYPV